MTPTRRKTASYQGGSVKVSKTISCGADVGTRTGSMEFNLLVETACNCKLRASLHETKKPLNRIV